MTDERRERQIQELLSLARPHRLVVVTGEPGSGRTWLMRRAVDRLGAAGGPAAIRVGDIGMAEPAEVTLLRLMSHSITRERIDEAELLGAAPEFLDQAVELCIRALNRFGQRVIVAVDGARRPLLDSLVRVAAHAPVLVLAVAAREEVPPIAYTVESVSASDLRKSVRRAKRQLSPRAARLCEDLAALTSSTGTLLVPDSLLGRYHEPAEGRPARHRLGHHELVESTGPGIRLRGAVAAEVTRRWSPDRRRDQAVDVLTTLLRDHLDKPALVERHTWTFVLAATRLLSLSRSRETESLVRSLAGTLERRGLVIELAALWRCGGPLPFATAPPDTRLTHASESWEACDLRTATRLLSTLPDHRHADGRLLHTRAAVACDRGDLRGVGPLLRRAIEAHQVAGDRTGEVWAMLHYGRWRLLSGDFDEAEKVLDAARVAFLDLHEAEGVRRAETEQARLTTLLAASGLLTTLPEQLPPGQDAHTGSSPATALANERLWPELGFWTWTDPLVSAWTEHHRAVRHEDGPSYYYSRPQSLEQNVITFARLGCAHGEAWAHLEHGIGAEDRSFAHARRLFASIGDEAGLAWTEVAEAFARRKDPPVEALRELSRRYPPALLARTEWPWKHGRLRIPFAARLLIPEPRYRETVFRLPATESRVRLTLQDDDPPTPGHPTRLTLQVVPGSHHPWAEAPALPWLSVRAIPLTPADLVPEHAVPVRPGPVGNTDAGAEFRFTPRRPGRHRIRFTVEDHLTGTVLQEVEADVDVTGPAESPLTGTTPTSLRRT
ncbi:hypothetical protein [Streptomyces sp. 4F14]|uniref:hypothetical protein n=1 Tax=Streptomyces sp. 4F14 TaxID=3394380 RepID=UPI003A867BCD